MTGVQTCALPISGAIPINNGRDLTKDNGWSGDAADLMALYRELTMKEK